MDGIMEWRKKNKQHTSPNKNHNKKLFLLWFFRLFWNVWYSYFRIRHCEVPVERRAAAFSANDRREQPSGTKEATEERPIDYYVFFDIFNSGELI